ncbi:glycerophosphodiester phosphodiesterase [Candidatus Falkowbacteria bacterium]|nr:glycerophosphodiester phosphodiesterase [Candidatus Falkowbacteria bacterium]
MALIVGHRGAAGYALGNTFASFAEAIRRGCQQIELDVRQTKDGKLVVIHDAAIAGFFNTDFLVADLTHGELDRVAQEQRFHVPTLAAVIDFCRGKARLQIELKLATEVAAVYHTVTQAQALGDCSFSSFAEAALTLMRQLDHQVELVYLCKSYTPGMLRFAQAVSARYMGLPGAVLTLSLITEMKQQGLLVYAYHVNDAVLGQQLIEWQVDALGTDFPSLFIS